MECGGRSRFSCDYSSWPCVLINDRRTFSAMVYKDSHLAKPARAPQMRVFNFPN
jgi:hypothetical protein